MKAQTCTWNGTTATVYLLDKGEKVARHQHTVEHITTVISGSTFTRIFETPFPDAIWSKPGESVVLPARIDHEISAGMDGTIVLNMIEGVHENANAGYPADHGGIMLHDGTVVR